jgi:hypothetical protein
MKALTPEQRAKKARLVTSLRAAHADAASAVAHYNEQAALLALLYDDTVARLDAADEVRGEALAFVTDVDDRLAAHLAAQSSGWHDTQAGGDYRVWQRRWDLMKLDLDVRRGIDPEEPAPFHDLDEYAESIEMLDELEEDPYR